MDSLTVNVPEDDMKLAVDSWQDGEEYVIRVRQTAPGQFDMIADETKAATEEEVAEPEPAAPPKAPIAATQAANPAIANVIAKGKKSASAAV